MPKKPGLPKTQTDVSERYSEPVVNFAGGLFGAIERRAEIDAAFDMFIKKYKEDNGWIGEALLSQESDIRADFERIWLYYYGGRDAESRAKRRAARPSFKDLTDKVEALAKALDGFNPALMPYLRIAYAGRRESHFPGDARDRIELFREELDQLTKACLAELDLNHRPGRIEDKILPGACRRIRDMIERRSSVPVPQTLDLISSDSFVSSQVEMLFQILLCIDPNLTPSAVQSALKKLKASNKGTNSIAK